MSCEENTRRRWSPDVSVEMEADDGVTQNLTGSLSSSSRRSKVRGYLLESGRSLAAFALGLLLASLYGLATLYLQKESLWFAVYSTLVMAALASFGMGLSAGIRAVVMVMLPTLCSAQGRKILLLLFATLLMSGPLTNTLENTERAAASVLCGAELAANQTQELLQRSATPLLSALDKIRTISRNAHAVAGRVQRLIHAMKDGVRHVARTLRNVLHFLADIGDVCNDRLGSPFRKCRDVFLEARSQCDDLLGEFNFLCAIVDAFLPLCHVARAGELFCIVPSYISGYLKEHLAAPTIAAFEKLRRDFDFNVTASFNLDVGVVSSQSLQQVTQNILREFSANLAPLKKISQPMAYAGLFLLALSFYRARMYRYKYLHLIDFDNFYISAQFKEFDHRMTSEGGASVLPITRKEAKTYITPLSCQLTLKEWKAALKGVVTVFRHFVIGCLVVALDFLLFWILDQVQHQVKEDVVARPPVLVSVDVNGSGFSSSIIRDLIASFDVLQKGNITVISRKCLMEPSAPDWTTCFTLGFLLGLSLLVSLIGGLMQRCRRTICAAYYPEREEDRIRFLHQKILNEREAELESMWNPKPGRGPKWLQSLLRWLPGGALLLGLCTSCSREDGDVSQCAGAQDCKRRFLNLGSTCVSCVRPSTSQEDNAMELRERVATATPRQSAGRPEGESDAEGGNEDYGSVFWDSDFSDLEMSYQHREASDESDSQDGTEHLQEP